MDMDAVEPAVSENLNKRNSIHVNEFESCHSSNLSSKECHTVNGQSRFGALMRAVTLDGEDIDCRNESHQLHMEGEGMRPKMNMFDSDSDSDNHRDAQHKRQISNIGLKIK